MISNVACAQKINKSQKVLKKGSAKIAAYFRRRAIPYFG
jgi:hypothetical protein